MAFYNPGSAWGQPERKQPKIPILWEPVDYARWPITHFCKIGDEFNALFQGKSNQVSEFGLWGMTFYLFTSITLTLLGFTVVNNAFATSLGAGNALAALSAYCAYAFGTSSLKRA